MSREFECRSLELTAAQWAALDRLAAQTGSVAPTGPAVGQANWRTLLKRIADGELEVGASEAEKDYVQPFLAAAAESPKF